MKTTFKIENDEIQAILGSAPPDFPKYTTQILNLANRNAQGARPAVVGQMSELIQEFSGQTLEEWERWYLDRHPEAIGVATDKIKEMVDNFKGAIEQIDVEMIKQWVADLVIVKTFIELKFQEAILRRVASYLKKDYRLAVPAEEAKGIDGYIGDVPISIKPFSYKAEQNLEEGIPVKIVFYEKDRDGIIVDMRHTPGLAW